MPRKTSTKPARKAASKTAGRTDAVVAIAISEDFGGFESGDAGASKTFPVQCSALRKGGHVMLKGRPCKIIEMATSSPGKHGHAKAHIVGMCIFSGKKHEDIFPSTHTVAVPRMKKEDYQVIGIWDGHMSLLDSKGVTKGAVRLPEGDMGVDIKQRFEADCDVMVTVQTAMDEEMVCGIKKMGK